MVIRFQITCTRATDNEWTCYVEDATQRNFVGGSDHRPIQIIELGDHLRLSLASCEALGSRSSVHKALTGHFVLWEITKLKIQESSCKIKLVHLLKEPQCIYRYQPMTNII